MSLEEFVFQACSFNHSDISPFRINHLQAVLDSLTQNALQILASAMRFGIIGLRACRSGLVVEIVSGIGMSPAH